MKNFTQSQKINYVFHLAEICVYFFLKSSDLVDASIIVHTHRAPRLKWRLLLYVYSNQQSSLFDLKFVIVFVNSFTFSFLTLRTELFFLIAYLTATPLANRKIQLFDCYSTFS